MQQTSLPGAGVFEREARLTFVHPVVRAAIYDALAPGERSERHSRAANDPANAGVTPELSLLTYCSPPRPANAAA